ncbi:MAG: protein-L-isoaspartate O-methyltransferase [Alphaproteobacteria bacterium]
MMDFALARRYMVDSQIRTNRVTDGNLLTVLAQVPRELFVPDRLRGVAYVDEDLTIKPGRCLMEPMVLARLIQTARIGPSDRVLDIGCATGYSTAVLGRLAGTVIAVESDPELAARATELLGQLGVDNATVIVAPMTQGYSKGAPYDAIVINGSVPRIADSIAAQLAEGGRLAAVISDGPGMGHGTLMTKTRGVLAARPVFDAGTPPLPGFEMERGFVF